MMLRVFLAAALVQGCSWNFVPNTAPYEPFPESLGAPLSCETKMDAPAGDVTLAVLSGVVSVAGYGVGGLFVDGGRDGEEIGGVAMIAGAGLFTALTAVFSASARHGFKATGRCHRAKVFYYYNGGRP